MSLSSVIRPTKPLAGSMAIRCGSSTEVAPRSDAQNYSGAFNAGVVLGNVLPQLVEAVSGIVTARGAPT